jgi:hypothetical protein
MRRITLPNRDRRARLYLPEPKPRQSADLRDLMRKLHSEPTAFRQAIAALPSGTLNHAWSELSCWECELAWDIYRRSGHRSEL